MTRDTILCDYDHIVWSDGITQQGLDSIGRPSEMQQSKEGTLYEAVALGLTAMRSSIPRSDLLVLSPLLSANR